MAEIFKVNPQYVSNLLGPLALTVAKDEGSELLSLINYSNRDDTRLVINCFIKPEFERLKESTKLQVLKSIAYFVGRSNNLHEVIESKLLLCEVPPAYHLAFLVDLWGILSPDKSASVFAAEVKSVVNRPLSYLDFAFEKNATSTLDEIFEKFREFLQINPKEGLQKP
ncbi:hypothetical protein RBH89_14545 [Paracidovorax avenae]